MKKQTIVFLILVLLMPLTIGGCVTVKTRGSFTQETVDVDGQPVTETLNLTQNQRSIWDSESLMKAPSLSHKYGDNRSLSMNGSDSEAKTAAPEMEGLGILFQFMQFLAANKSAIPSVAIPPEPRPRASPSHWELPKLEIGGYQDATVLKPP